MVVAEFEEKEFEVPLDAQLSGGGPLWAPGQVLEALVGFDVAIIVEDLAFWASVCGVNQAPAGLAISPRWWHRYRALFIGPLLRLRSPPPFKLNVFLQHKRPEYLIQGAERSTWTSPYFRIKPVEHQQAALEACTTALGSLGLVAYASSAFHRRPDLFKHIEQRTLIANTHFARASALTGHRTYTYTSARGGGKAHSEPVDVEPLVFLRDGDVAEPPNDPPTAGASGDGPSPRNLLEIARDAAKAAVTESPSIVGGRAFFEGVEKAAFNELDRIGPLLDRGNYYAETRAFITATIFAQLSGVRWFVM